MDADPSSLARALALNLIIMVLSLSVHEYAHALVADRLGDDTPRRQGRLTLSPLEHYDVFGTFVVPIFMTIFGGGIAFIGWARPVETVPSNYTRKLSMGTGHALVAVAGPLANLLFAIVATVAYAILASVDPSALSRGDTTGAAGAFLYTAVLVNAGLFVFNLIPLPPLDGSRLLPRSLDDLQAQIAPFSFIIIMIVLNVPGVRQIFWGPVEMIATLLHAVARAASGGAA